jgi:hypothetical protein
MANEKRWKATDVLWTKWHSLCSSTRRDGRCFVEKVTPASAVLLVPVTTTRATFKLQPKKKSRLPAYCTVVEHDIID